MTFTQFLSPKIGLTLGKLDITSGDMNEFAHGKGDTQFFNLAFNFNPIAALTVPYTPLGFGVIALPTGDPKVAVVTLFALDANGEANRSGFDTVFDGEHHL